MVGVFKFLTLNKKVLIGFLVLVGVFVLLSPEFKKTPRYYLFERPFVYTINIVQSGFGLVFKGVSTTLNNYINLIGLKEENQRLMSENKRLHAEAVSLKEKALAYDRLMELLKVKEIVNTEYAVASIIAKDPTNWYRVVVINMGERDRLKPNMGVITADGVLGRIVKTTSSYSRVLLLSDRNSAIAAMIQRTRAEGIVVGRGGGILKLNYIMIDSDVQRGDLVLTSGTDGVFPPGIVVGSVVNIESPKNALFHTIDITPAVDLSKVREIMVLKIPQVPEIERLLKEGVE